MSSSFGKVVDGKALKACRATSDFQKKLATLVKQLRRMEQGDQLNCPELNSAAAELVRARVLRHRDGTVRMLAACCLTEVFRVYAPDAPYSAEQQRSAFRLIIDQLRGLSAAPGAQPADTKGGKKGAKGGKKKSGNSNQYERAFFLLEQMAEVKSCVLLNELDDHDDVGSSSQGSSKSGGSNKGSGGGGGGELVVMLFECLLDTVLPAHAPKVATYMVDVMSAVLEESSEAVSPRVLEALLRRLLPGARRENQRAYEVAGDVLRYSADVVRDPLTRFVTARCFTRTRDNMTKSRFVHLFTRARPRISHCLFFCVRFVWLVDSRCLFLFCRACCGASRACATARTRA